ncbi:glycosyltransferase [Pseudomonas putida]|uniref:glycosyltransferase n=1 Tax=Pseudomonas putida TaxID=303 RepID=UPI001A8F3835|nr:glycosyltransferase [Pseudomonas putida]
MPPFKQKAVKLLGKIKRKLKTIVRQNREIKLNIHEKHLNKKHLFYKLANIAPGVSYRLDGELQCRQEASAKAVVFSVVYFNTAGRVVTPPEKLFGFSTSDRFGNYKYLPASPEGEPFTLYLTLPEGATAFQLKLIAIKKANDVFLKPGTRLGRIKIENQRLTSNIISAIERHLASKEPLTLEMLAKYAKPIDKAKNKYLILMYCYEYFAKTSVDAAHFFGRLAFLEHPNEDLLVDLRGVLTQAGRMYDLESFLNQAAVFNQQKGWNITSRRISDEIDKLENGFAMPPALPSPRHQAGNSVLYLLHNSLPYNSGGYATRTHGLLKGIKADGRFVAHAVSRPGFPSDHKQYISGKLPDVIPAEDLIDDIRYLRCDQKTRKSSLTLTEYVDTFSQQLVTFAQANNVGFIHAASNYPNGLAAVKAARQLGIKSVYEVRGLWEITRMSRQADWEHTEQFAFNAKMEAEACIHADAVITITQALKDLMVVRGVDPAKIIVAPNCAHTELFHADVPKDAEMSAQLGIAADDVVIGYVGSIVNYEGLDDLLRAVAMLRDRGVTKFKFLLIGDGAELPRLKLMIDQLGLNELVICTGRVPHADVPRYYSLIDIAPFPRKPYLVCETVSPLKPFEALASGKAILVSSCAALTEIIEDGYNGLVFEKGNVEDFCDQLQRMIGDHALRERLGRQGRDWVCRERDWSVVSGKVADLYETLVPPGQAFGHQNETTRIGETQS